MGLRMQLLNQRPCALDEVFDRRERAVAKLQVDDARRVPQRGRAELEIAILRYDGVILADRKLPNRAVIGSVESKLNHVPDLATKSESRRVELGPRFWSSKSVNAWPPAT